MRESPAPQPASARSSRCIPAIAPCWTTAAAARTRTRRSASTASPATCSTTACSSPPPGSAVSRRRWATRRSRASSRCSPRRSRPSAGPEPPTKGSLMTTAKPVPAVYARLGVRPVIHGSGTTTRYGGSLMRPETIDAMRERAQALVNIDELNVAAGAAIARMLGAEAALVTAGSAAGLVLQAAACITGDDPSRVARLPDVTGLRHEFVIQRAHRFSYDQSYRVPGGVLVEIGLARRTQPWELEQAIGGRTAGVIFLVSPFASPPGTLAFEEVVRIAHARGVPVLVDAASMIPPRDNLFRYLRVRA